MAVGCDIEFPGREVSCPHRVFEDELGSQPSSLVLVRDGKVTAEIRTDDPLFRIQQQNAIFRLGEFESFSNRRWRAPPDARFPQSVLAETGRRTRERLTGREAVSV